MKKIFTFLVFIQLASAGLDNTSRTLSKVKGNSLLYDRVAAALVQDGYPFSAISFAKEFLATTRNAKVNDRFEQSIEEIITKVGVRQFETLPDGILKRSSAPAIQYIRAKKMFRRGRYKSAYSILRSIDAGSEVAPFAMMLKGSVLSLMKRDQDAIDAYEQCVNISGKYVNRYKSEVKAKQYKIARDYCIIGKARALFTMQKYDDANLAFLDLDKSSFVWPEILFEEAWTSFYQRDFNRTLGKLVTYQAPVFKHFFIPEIDVLKALSYLELCLWADTKKVVDDFYKNNYKRATQFSTFLRRKGKNYDFFYKAAAAKSKRKNLSGGSLFNELLYSVVFDPGYQELTQTLELGVGEFKRLKAEANSRAKRDVLLSLSDSLRLQKRLIGSYVRKRLLIKYALLKKAFTQMSNIKLEVLARNKSELYYRETDVPRERGDIRYLQRNEKQYFWTFNGEFWADELGDYVFALRSECK